MDILNTGFLKFILNAVTGGTPPAGSWILTTGFWDDSGIWIDSDVWVD